MAILNQKTINKPIAFEGITLHKGKQAKIKILPSAPNSGITFKRVDLNKDNLILANFYNVSDATLCTTLTNESGISVSTVEHLMAALYGMGVDNALIEVDQEEIPILDGYSKKFVEAIKEVGLKDSDTPIKIGVSSSIIQDKGEIEISQSVNVYNASMVFSRDIPEGIVIKISTFSAVLSSNSLIPRSKVHKVAILLSIGIISF